MIREWRRKSTRRRAERIPMQLEVLRRGVLLLAAQSELWMTLEELARKTKFPVGQHLGAAATPAQRGVRRV
jgi:hypothetical protein